MSLLEKIAALVDHERYLVRLLSKTALKWDRDRSLQQAGALALQTVLAAIPSIAVALNWLDPDTLADFLRQYVLPRAERHVAGELATIAARARVGPIGFVATLVFAGMLFTDVESVWNDIWEVGKRRKLATRILLYLVLALVGPAAAAISVYITAHLWQSAWTSFFWSFFVVWLALSLANYLLPNTRVRIYAAMVGAAVSALLYELAKVGFSIYVSRIAARQEGVYGPLAVVMLLIVWVYWSWLVALFGAKFAYAVHHSRRLAGGPPLAGDAGKG